MKTGGRPGTKFQPIFGSNPPSNLKASKYKRKGPSYRKPVSFFATNKADLSKYALPGNHSADEADYDSPDTRHKYG